MTDEINVLALHCVGGRLNPEPSRAREARYYGDPAKSIRFECESGGEMRGKQNVASFDNLAPIDKILSIWADFMHLHDSQATSGYANPQDVKDFMRLGEAVEAMVNDLRRHQWWAIRKSRGICTQWMFPDASYGNALTQAKEILSGKMRTHIATAKYFS